MSNSTDWPEQVDQQILTELRDNGPDYVPLIANRRGLHVQTVRRRCDQLVTVGYVEKVTEETIFRITEAGERRLAELNG